MENFNPKNNNNEQSDDNFKEKSNFFFKESTRNVFGGTAILTGSLFAFAGLYETFTNQKVSHLIGEYSHNIPEILNKIIEHADKIPDYVKDIIGGNFLISGGLLLSEDDE